MYVRGLYVLSLSKIYFSFCSLHLSLYPYDTTGDRTLSLQTASLTTARASLGLVHSVASLSSLSRTSPRTSPPSFEQALASKANGCHNRAFPSDNALQRPVLCQMDVVKVLYPPCLVKIMAWKCETSNLLTASTKQVLASLHHRRCR